MTNIDEEFYYKVSYRRFGYGKRFVMTVYERRPFLWFHINRVIEDKVLIGEQYGREDPMIAARDVVYRHKWDQEFAETIELDTLVRVEKHQ